MAKCHTPESPSRVLELCLPVLCQVFRHNLGNCQHWLIPHLLIGPGVTTLAKDPLPTTPRAAVDIDGADIVDEEVATGRIVLAPTLGLQPGLAPGPSSR